MRYPPNVSKALVAIAIAIGTSVAAAPAGAAPQAAHTHDHATAPAAAVPARGWATDAPLRDGMRGIATIVQALDAGPGPVDAARARTAGAQVGRQVAAIVANCRLPPDADAALHPVLADLARGGAALATDPGDASALPLIRQALADYARLFDDPGFQVP